jgi:hypothetical protein
MLTPIGVGLIMFGLYLLVFTVGRRITSEEDFRESEARQKELAEQGLGGLMAAPEAWSRAAYRHPVRTRLPLQLCVAVGAVLIVVDILNG